MNEAEFQEEATRLLELLGAVSTRLEAVASRGTLPPAAAQAAAALRTGLLDLLAPAGRRLLAEDGARWIAAAKLLHQRLLAVATALKGTPEEPLLARAVRDSGALLTRLDTRQDPAGPPLGLLAVGAAAAFGLAWYLFRNGSVSGDPDDPDGHEAPGVEILPPEPSGPREDYELEDEPEDVEVEPA